MTAPQSTKSDSSDESGGTGSDTAAALGFDPRYLWLGIAALVFAVGTGLALYQDPRPDPFQPVQTLSPDWWRYPVERNAFKRLPAIGGSLNAVYAHKDGRRLWAVGDAGLIVHSDDGGRTWVRQTWIPRASRQVAVPFHRRSRRNTASHRSSRRGRVHGSGSAEDPGFLHRASGWGCRARAPGGDLGIPAKPKARPGWHCRPADAQGAGSRCGRAASRRSSARRRRTNRRSPRTNCPGFPR